jgi:hypothetical protein
MSYLLCIFPEGSEGLGRWCYRDILVTLQTKCNPHYRRVGKHVVNILIWQSGAGSRRWRDYRSKYHPEGSAIGPNIMPMEVKDKDDFPLWRDKLVSGKTQNEEMRRRLFRYELLYFDLPRFSSDSGILRSTCTCIN